jgi:hypothetical protein
MNEEIMEISVWVGLSKEMKPRASGIGMTL